MSVLNISACRTAPETDLEQLDELAVALSGRLSRLQTDDVVTAMAAALGQIARGVSAECRLVEFAACGTPTRTHSHAGPGPHPQNANVSSHETWLFERLARGESVIISRPEEFPREALATRRSGTCSMLGVPARVAGHVVCALVIDRVRSPRWWPQPMVDRLRLITEILGTALQRCRHEDAMRASHAEHVEIERLNSRLQADTVSPTGENTTYHDGDDIVGESAPLRLALTRLNRVAPMKSTVLLLGPTGSGKELFARALHQRSRRHARPLVRVNCAALPPTLVESELFGHEKGAFTGAVGCASGTIRAGRRRNDLPGRDRRSVARGAGEVFARPAGR